MTTTEQQLEEIKSRKRAKELERARTEAQADAAREQVKEATKLLMEMGCSTIEEARARMAQLQRDIDEQLEEMRKSL